MLKGIITFLLNVKYYIKFSYNSFKNYYISITKTPKNHFFFAKNVRNIFFIENSEFTLHQKSRMK